MAFFFGIGAILVLIFLVSVLGQEGILTFLLRGILGSAILVFFQFYCLSRGYPMLVGVNPISFLTCASLGFPGLILLFLFQLLFLL